MGMPFQNEKRRARLHGNPCGGAAVRLEAPSEAEAAAFNLMDNACLNPAKLEVLGWQAEVGPEEGFDRAARRYEHTAGARVSHLTFIPDPPPKLIFPRTVLDSLVRKPFEMLSLPVPTCAHAYLTQLYGDWRKHVVGASIHGRLLLDLDHPYTHYLSPACEA